MLSPWLCFIGSLCVSLFCCSDGFVGIHPPLPKVRITVKNGVSRSSSSSSRWPLHSINQLLDDIESSKSSQKTIFVGGKGGVGKTTISSAIAVELATLKQMKVLIVSTDPAHSLGDALDVDLRGGKPVPLTDSLTANNLWAQEIDAVMALDEFRDNLASFDVTRLADALQIDPEILRNFGLTELSDLLQNPPPGLDELVALSNVLNFQEYDVVIVDTAPTGHTLRLLALPEFLDGLLGKLITFRMQLSKISNTISSFLGDAAAANQRQQTIDNALSKLEIFKTKMQTLRRILQDPTSTKFVVVTIPTVLGVAETKRLVQSLESQNVRVSDIVINQCVNIEDETALEQNDYYQHRKQGQQKWINEITQAAARVSATSEYQANGGNGDIVITQVPFWDVELVGAPALDYIGSQIFIDNPGFTHLLEKDSSFSKLVLCGGKGGVGKTTTSASLAVHLAKAGHKVALISTDPAHSLGDAVQMDLRGGKLQDCTVWNAEGSLSVLEIDPAASLSQFKGVVDQLLGENIDIDNAGLRSTLQDLQQVFDTLPAGTDEVVALAKIVNLMKEYDRIVIDTAPTGHTLRMLSTPGFLADLIEKLLKISDKINANPLLQMYLGRRENIREGIEQAKSTLLKFQFQMYDLEDLFSDPNVTEFLIVLVPTELAVRESIRLLNDLTFQSPDMPIKVRNIVVNQVLSEDKDSAIFLDHVANSQKLAIGDLERFVVKCDHRPMVTKVPYLDTEPRGVYGLKIVSDKLLHEELPVVETNQ